MGRFYHEQKNTQSRRASSQSKDSGVVAGKQHWQYGGHPELVIRTKIPTIAAMGIAKRTFAPALVKLKSLSLETARESSTRSSSKRTRPA